MKVDIWIVTRFFGKFSSGLGECGILLETTVKDKPFRKIHCAGWREISYQGLQVRAMVEAMNRMTKPAEVTVHIDSLYAAYVAEHEAEIKAHAKQWKEYKSKAGKMNSCHVIREMSDTYRSAILKELNEHRFRIRKDG